ncbi:hypothetical protein SEA_FLAPPER_96 [Gordonia phage Flapper]|uniref:Uncharacterized protein n=1 Tax=Gordonia phage Flapper TaxID=2079415 RepID=A0A2L1IXC1_9CAUD|nr:hypothetical protein KNT82_gp96 [Gordonia phage Flapper]AVD99839.1 hypothetical protein SEA_FLAPPER_96 [Gordonia phage Flapper]
MSHTDDAGTFRFRCQSCGDRTVTDALAPRCDRCVSAGAALTKPLPDTGLYRAMDSGHRNRHGHGLLAHLESTDGGALWSVVTDCCRRAAD